MKDSIQIILGIAALIGIIYGVFKVESAIYKTIEDLNKAINAKINILERDIYKAIEDSSKSTNTKVNAVERDLALHVAVYTKRKGTVDYLFHGLEEKMNHIKNRLLDEIKQLKAEQNHKRKSDEG